MRKLLAALTVLGALVAAAPGMAANGRIQFHSPSGNIRCTIAKPFGTPAAACVTLEPARAADVYDGARARVGRRSKVGFIRAGFTLDYGRSVRRFGFRCTSRLRGVTCSDIGTGRGFTICREGANTFPGGRPTPCRGAPPVDGGGDANPPTRTGNCNPNYTPCIPNAADLDCKADNLPTVRVIGTDVYRLDRDGDGYGCDP
jgi:hypothetical protein